MIKLLKHLFCKHAAMWKQVEQRSLVFLSRLASLCTSQDSQQKAEKLSIFLLYCSKVFLWKKKQKQSTGIAVSSLPPLSSFRRTGAASSFGSGHQPFAHESNSLYLFQSKTCLRYIELSPIWPSEGHLSIVSSQAGAVAFLSCPASPQQSPSWPPGSGLLQKQCPSKPTSYTCLILHHFPYLGQQIPYLGKQNPKEIHIIHVPHQLVRRWQSGLQPGLPAFSSSTNGCVRLPTPGISP